MPKEQRIVVRPNRIPGIVLIVIGLIPLVIAIGAVGGGASVNSVTGWYLAGMIVLIGGIVMMMIPLVTVTPSRVIYAAAGGMKNQTVAISGLGSIRVNDGAIVEAASGKSIYSFTSFAAKADIDKLRRRLDSAAG